MRAAIIVLVLLSSCAVRPRNLPYYYVTHTPAKFCRITDKIYESKNYRYLRGVTGFIPFKKSTPMTNLFEMGETVEVDLPEVKGKMMVVLVIFNSEVESWQYQLAHINKDGSRNRVKNNWVINENCIKKT